jgi:hypothetical protein
MNAGSSLQGRWKMHNRGKTTPRPVFQAQRRTMGPGDGPRDAEAKAGSTRATVAGALTAMKGLEYGLELVVRQARAIVLNAHVAPVPRGHKPDRDLPTAIAPGILDQVFKQATQGNRIADNDELPLLWEAEVDGVGKDLHQITDEPAKVDEFLLARRAFRPGIGKHIGDQGLHLDKVALDLFGSHNPAFVHAKAYAGEPGTHIMGDGGNHLLSFPDDCRQALSQAVERDRHTPQLHGARFRDSRTGIAKFDPRGIPLHLADRAQRDRCDGETQRRGQKKNDQTRPCQGDRLPAERQGWGKPDIQDPTVLERNGNLERRDDAHRTCAFLAQPLPQWNKAEWFKADVPTH